MSGWCCIVGGPRASARVPRKAAVPPPVLSRRCQQRTRIALLVRRFLALVATMGSAINRKGRLRMASMR